MQRSFRWTALLQHGNIFSLALLVLCGCQESSPGSPVSDGQSAAYAGDYPFQVVTTTGMVTDIVQIVAGGNGRVTGLMGEDVDPHLYKPLTSDVKQLLAADIVFYSGLMLEGRLGLALEQVSQKGKPAYAVTEQIDKRFLRTPAEFAGHPDPHVWMDVTAWSRCVGFVAEMLAEFDPPNADNYQNNAEVYREELKKLDDYAREVIATIPEEQRVLVTAHDAFEYFSRAYEIPVRSVQGISTDSEAGLDDINRLVDFIVARQVPTIFVESSVSQKNIRAVVEGAQQRGWNVKIAEDPLFSDAMGKPGSYEGTYIGMIDHNATVIARALGGAAPETGMNGKLGLGR